MPVMICSARQKVSTMPQIHIQFRFLGVGIMIVSYSSPRMGRRLCSHFSPPDFGS
jgi:hypothetical protein